jgi:hypothetical protein
MGTVRTPAGVPRRGDSAVPGVKPLGRHGPSSPVHVPLGVHDTRGCREVHVETIRLKDRHETWSKGAVAAPERPHLEARRSQGGRILFDHAGHMQRVVEPSTSPGPVLVRMERDIKAVCTGLPPEVEERLRQ